MLTTEPRDWDMRIKEMVEIGLYNGGGEKATHAFAGDQGLRPDIADANTHSTSLQGELAWRSNIRTTATQMKHQQVSHSSFPSF